MDNDKLKLEGLLERLANIVQKYENEIADLRVAYTLLAEKANSLQEELDKHNE